MTFVPRGQPYRLDPNAIRRAEDLATRLPEQITNADLMFQYLFEDLRKLYDQVQALVPSTNTVVVKTIVSTPGPIGMMGEDGQDGDIGPPGQGSGSGTGGGLTNAQIAARVLLDAPGGGSGGVAGQQSASSGAQGPAGPTGPQGATGIQGITGVPGQDGDDSDPALGLFRPQTFDGDLRATTSQMVSWVSKSFGTVYQALSDGLVIAYGASTAGLTQNLTLLSDSSNPPTTTRAAALSGNGGSGVSIPLTGVVRKGDFYKVVDASGTGTAIWWIPLGTAG